MGIRIPLPSFTSPRPSLIASLRSQTIGEREIQGITAARVLRGFIHFITSIFT